MLVILQTLGFNVGIACRLGPKPSALSVLEDLKADGM